MGEAVALTGGMGVRVVSVEEVVVDIDLAEVVDCGWVRSVGFEIKGPIQIVD